jgi:hypothetical protein
MSVERVAAVAAGARKPAHDPASRFELADQPI